jgi:serine/threonine protein kinase/formylglycine-generating enzyme required for sulfatase activity
MNGDLSETGPFLMPPPAQRDEHLRDQFEQAWAGSPRPRIEDYLEQANPADRTDLLRQLLALELELRCADGERPTPDEYERRFPHHSALVRAVFRDAGCLPPEWIGRYRVRSQLGSGGFGHVYLCYDDKADRPVAVKVPRRDRVASAETERQMLHEARSVARLNHAGIVPLYDVGEHEGQCFLVFKYIEGMSLAQLLQQGPVPQGRSAGLVAQIAQALHHAHGENLYHRDIKPANILLDQQGQPYITDFGLAIREEDLPRERGRGAGTYPYMSPEQVRREGHRIDGRTDVYSLGVVFYELLSGRRPFRGNYADVIDQILQAAPRPPRQFNHAIHPELERICLKALAKQMSARYPTAGDMAEELRAVVESLCPLAAVPSHPGRSTSLPESGTRTVSLPSSPAPLPVVPKGLRSFGREDSQFFLRLLPGPRDRDGLPESIRFWKVRIENQGEDAPFAVGLLYGPSGCGKTSLIKAGLLPRLAPTVLPLYVEATREHTEMQLAKALEKACPDLGTGSPLPMVLAQFRSCRSPRSHSRLLLVLDQFEQWLHAHGPDMENTELTAALRQADGEHIQVILMVRDDFWMSTSRLFDYLEINLDRARNSRAVDLFDTDHSRHVLGLFGQAYNRFPAESDEWTKDQEAFLHRAVAELSQESRVNPVRLSLFADLMKDRPWTSAALLEVGGAEGVGVRFLEETFTARTASPELRALEKPARRLLQALLPERGTNIKGRTRSRSVLAEASGVAEDSPRFARLLDILDRDLHILSPTELDPEVLDETDPEAPTRLLPSSTASPPEPDNAGTNLPVSYYQLTHDYLVPALRQWLTQERRKRWRGRAELCLEERTAEWSGARGRRNLPSALEYVNIVLAVPRRKRTGEQRALLRTAARVYATRWGSALAGLLVLVLVIQQYVSSVRIGSREESMKAEVRALFSTSPEGVGFQIQRLQQYQELAKPALQDHLRSATVDGRQRLRAACALIALGYEDSQEREIVGEARDFLVKSIAQAHPGECRNIVAALRPIQGQVTEELQNVARNKSAGDATRARYATVLLHFGDPQAAEEILAAGPDATPRTTFIHGFKSWHGDLLPLARILQSPDRPALTSGLCAALGLIDPESLDSDEERELKMSLLDRYQHARDGGTHSAAGWALRQWKTPLPVVEPSQGASSERDWFINRQDMTMLRLRADRFVMGDVGHKGFWFAAVNTIGLLGSPEGQGPLLAMSAALSTRSLHKTEVPPHWVTLTRPFFISDRAVSVAQFQRFLKDPRAEKPLLPPSPNTEVSPTLDCPVQTVNWFDALLFCNWLSDQEGLTRCYERTGEKEKVKTFELTGYMDVVCDVWRWKPGANGYRLPIEAEWEYACRAGTVTHYCFGDDVSLLGNYAIFRDIHTAAGASRLPNGWGAFDMHGNVVEWCWDRYGPFSGIPANDPTGAERGTDRVARGGYFDAPPILCTSSIRSRIGPTQRSNLVGFRVVCAGP